MPIKSIPLKLIDRDDHTFSLLPFAEPPTKALTRHIAQNGVIHPPLVKEGADGAFRIVAGRKRLRIVGDLLKQRSCDCLVVGADLDTLSTLTLALDEALMGGPVSPLVKACFFKKAIGLCPPDEAARRFLPLFGLSPHPVHLPKIVGLVDLEEPLARALHEGRLDDKTASALIDLSFRDRFALFDLIDTLRLSVMNQRKVLAICEDLAKRQGTSIHAILASQELKEIIDHPEANPPQKAAQVMRTLIQQHSPDLTAAEHAFAELTCRLNLPKGFVLNHAPAFARDEVTLTITFPNREALVTVWPELKGVLGYTPQGGAAQSGA